MIPRSSPRKNVSGSFRSFAATRSAYHVVFIPSTEVDRRGVHIANIEGMRRAVAGLPVRPGYVLSDGFRVPGLPMPSLPVIGGDAAAACIAAASVLAKVSRDRLMVAMEAEHPRSGLPSTRDTARLCILRRCASGDHAISIGIRSSMCDASRQTTAHSSPPPVGHDKLGRHQWRLTSSDSEEPP